MGVSVPKVASVFLLLTMLLRNGRKPVRFRAELRRAALTAKVILEVLVFDG